MYSVLRYLRKRCYEAANTGLAMDEINRTPKSYLVLFNVPNMDLSNLNAFQCSNPNSTIECPFRCP